ncbi:carboxypeptidase-like regulatory domain-containing protein [Flammeovirga yaeyamensis]|uniref:Carboxypeptidase-like regulatory domain-containing protein n=1 Tax=Flammeovirga yaeyamensis TaxID=367791 RepID=A0AAX1N344_9BACT|nr:alpha-2-macroglobulin family protein [Flammeovirga yaeyamensis]MBB3701032.1 hypothetical protein [Flammeovirga yaeyamensis]NMF38135.1 TonB-dependent receptor plug domain-containing protein [Flammeovirga yaeyamensis]QWG01906.1 carboxypeptidase-like regulatory domain-containing protein [Flammeovirga yaeyamensis]
MKSIFLIIKRLFFLFSFFIFCQSTWGQKLLESRQTSVHTYVFQLSQEEAKTIYKEGVSEIDETYFHTLVDSFATDGYYAKNLPEGHYLYAFAKGGELESSVVTVENLDVFIVQNSTDLIVQLFDINGALVTDAEVKVKNKTLRFDKKLKAFVDKKSDKKGLLEVTYKGFTTYRNLEKDIKYSRFRRGINNVLFRSPLKYVTIPVNFIIHIPVDGVKSIFRRGTYGTISRIKYFSIRTFERVACIFDDYYCNGGSYYSKKYHGYFTLSQPKYKPGDTLKLKAFITNKKGKPIKGNVHLFIRDGYGYRSSNKKPVKMIVPYVKGGYSFEFPLDSLNLTLDKRYTLSLETEYEDEFLSTYFYFEDYELGKNKLHVRTDSEKQYKGEDLKMYIKGTDENDLQLMDARVEIDVISRNVLNYFDDSVFIKNKITSIKKDLKPQGETEVIIPDSLFENVNMKYTVKVKMFTSDNENIIEKRDFHYFSKEKYFDISLQADSIHFDYFENGKSKAEKVEITAYDNFGNQTSIFEGELPFATAVSSYYSDYKMKNDSLSSYLRLHQESPMLSCYTHRTSDSVFIQIDNPRKLPFDYHIYKKNNKKAEGYSDSLNYAKKAAHLQNYYIMLNYLWGGEMKTENYLIPIAEKKLNVEVKEPSLIYPGQKAEIEVLVTDYKGKPVKNVDVTAYSLTNKFDAQAPELNDLSKRKKDKKLINNFSVNDIETNNCSLTMDYPTWNALAGLDSIEYYQFLYPSDSMYYTSYPVEDSVTQFAPFITNNGKVEPIKVVYVDGKPAYFSFTSVAKPYSILVSSGKHNLRIRTERQEIHIDSVYFEKGKKTIISAANEHGNERIQVREKLTFPTSSEENNLKRYLFSFRNTFNGKYAFLENYDELHLLGTSLAKSKNKRFTTGPVLGDYKFNLINEYETHFNQDYQFEFEFGNQLLKMREVKRYEFGLDNWDFQLDDEVYTLEKINKMWEQEVALSKIKIPTYRNPSSTEEGKGTLNFKLETYGERKNDLLLNVVMMKNDDINFIRVYQGGKKEYSIRNLEEGGYKLILFFNGEKYHIEDEVWVKKDGINYYSFDFPREFKKDNFSKEVSKIIEKIIFEPSQNYYKKQERLESITKSYQREYGYTGEGKVVSGYVLEKDTNEPLPGVNVLIEGTTYGTATDFDGYYELRTPYSGILEFNYIGYEFVEIDLMDRSTIDVLLEPSLEQLDEIVVIGYGTQKKYEITGSVSSVTSRSLYGQVAGVSVNATPGSSPNITIRGVSSTAKSGEPLVIINGKVFTGDFASINKNNITSIEILSAEKAGGIYGTRAVHGVMIISMSDEEVAKMGLKLEDKKVEDQLIVQSDATNSLRDNFSDNAFWQPQLTTDKDGKVKFEVVFPDDITKWDTHYLAMNNKKQTGQVSSAIKSYKPLMTQLNLPRFLVAGDTAMVLGKTLNYSPSTVNVSVDFSVDDQNIIQKEMEIEDIHIDTVSVTSKADSLHLKYTINTSSGYFDGEKRSIPVFPIGLEKAKGTFSVLDGDTTIQLSFDDNESKVQLYATSDYLNIVEDEVRSLISYRYLCNEQLASKLKAHLAQMKIAKFKGKKYKKEGDIKRIIKKIVERADKKYRWGWWPNSASSQWITQHVLEALQEAERLGFKVEIDKEVITDDLVYRLAVSKSKHQRITLIETLSLLNAKVDYQKWIDEIYEMGKLDLYQKLQLMKVQAQSSLSYSMDTVAAFKQVTIFGNYFYSDTTKQYHYTWRNPIVNNDVQNTLLVYQILKLDSVNDHSSELKKMRNYLLEKRSEGNWGNTYSSANVVETILPDLLDADGKERSTKLVISGDIQETVSEFPYEKTLENVHQITIEKEGTFPVYFSSYQYYWDENPERRADDFIVNTHFEGIENDRLEAGENVTLIAEVEVKKESDYVMINVPIPAGCSYASKRQSYYGVEVHREYFKNETAIFCKKMPKGKYTFKIELDPRYSGEYHLNPAKAELMYFPTFYGNNELRKVGVE